MANKSTLIVFVLVATMQALIAQELIYSELQKAKHKAEFTSYVAKDGSTYKVGDRLKVLSVTGKMKYAGIEKGKVGWSLYQDDKDLQKATEIEVVAIKIYSSQDFIHNDPECEHKAFLVTADVTNAEKIYRVYIDIASEENEIQRAGTENVTASTSQNSKVTPGNSTPHISSSTKNGSVAADAKTIDCDEIFPFKEGLAIVKKGTSYGVINSKGDFVVPYNKWLFIRHTDVFGTVPEGFVNGSCVVQGLNNEGYGLIDTQGKIIVPCENLIVFPFDNYGLAVIANKDKYYFVDRSNKRTEIPGSFLRRSENLNMESLFMSKTVQNILMIKGTVSRVFTEKGISIGRSDKGYTVFGVGGVPKSTNYFTNARHFSEGLAAVSKANEFGETKWGFIDEQGKVVIPLQFSNEPGDFSEGLALVIPMDQNDFHYAYIDRTGKVVLTIKENLKDFSFGSSKLPLATSPDQQTDFPQTGRFQGNYAFLPYAYDYNTPFLLIDKTGKSQMKFLESLIGKSIRLGESRYQSYYYALTDGQMLLQRNGLLDLKRKFVILPGTFDELTPFDPVSNLARARKKNTMGYINRSGEFVIMIGKPASKW